MWNFLCASEVDYDEDVDGIFVSNWMTVWLAKWMNERWETTVFLFLRRRNSLPYVPSGPHIPRNFITKPIFANWKDENTKNANILWDAIRRQPKLSLLSEERTSNLVQWRELQEFFSYAKYSKLWMLQRVLQSVKINLIMIFFSLPFSCCPKYKRTAPYPCCYSTGTGNIFINENLFIERQIKKKWYFSVCECLISTSCESSSMWS